MRMCGGYPMDCAKKYGLSIIQPGGGKGKAYAEWQAEQDGKPTWRTAIRMDIRETVAESFSWRQFISMMEKKGYSFKLNRKYIALRAPGMERYVRLKSLGKNYTEEASGDGSYSPKFPKGNRLEKEIPQSGKSFTGCRPFIILIFTRWGFSSGNQSVSPMWCGRISGVWMNGSPRWNFCRNMGSRPGKN